MGSRTAFRALAKTVLSTGATDLRYTAAVRIHSVCERCLLETRGADQHLLQRRLCSTLSDLEARLDQVNRDFAEAREEIDLAREVGLSTR